MLTDVCISRKCNTAPLRLLLDSEGIGWPPASCPLGSEKRSTALLLEGLRSINACLIILTIETRVFKHWTNKAEVFAGRKGLLLLCVCACGVFVWTPSDQSGALILTLCVGGVASPTQNSLPRSTTQPTQVQHTSSSNRTSSQAAAFHHIAFRTGITAPSTCVAKVV